MAEIWEIARYVEEHPDDYGQRWRLAKKLYGAWEYRLALEHLLVLKNEWQRKLNVVRYLAATYYRLGRHDEAIDELRAAIEIWPQELGLREQLARVLEIAGDKVAAREVWQEIVQLDPHHPIAVRAVKRMDAREEKAPEDDLHLSDSDCGIALKPGLACAVCGAQNSDEFERCWQCHSALGEETAMLYATPRITEQRQLMFTPEALGLAVGVMVFVLIGLAVYLTITLFFSQPPAGMVLSTLSDLWRFELGVTRAVAGVALILGWPLLIRLGISLVRPERRVPGVLITLTGLTLGALAFVSTWLTSSLIGLAVLLPVVLSLAIILVTFDIGVVRALNVWAFQLAAMVVTLVVVVVASESAQCGYLFNPFKEIPAIVAYAQAQAGAGRPGVTLIPDRKAPISQRIQWVSTGSQWIDHRAGAVEFTVYTEEKDAGLKFEINQGETKPCALEYVKGKKWSYTYRVKSGETYNVKVYGAEDVPARLECAGLLIPHFLPAEN